MQPRRALPASSIPSVYDTQVAGFGPAECQPDCEAKSFLVLAHCLERLNLPYCGWREAP